MKSTKTNNKLALRTDVPSILSTLDEELSSLKKITDKPYITTGNTILGNTSIDIKTETKIDNLVKVFSSISGRASAYQKAMDELGIDQAPEFNVEGGTLAQWKEDIQKRLSVIKYEDRKNTLQGFKDKMSKFLSEEDQKKVLLEEMRSYLGK